MRHTDPTTGAIIQHHKTMLAEANTVARLANSQLIQERIEHDTAVKKLENRIYRLTTENRKLLEEVKFSRTLKRVF